MPLQIAVCLPPWRDLDDENDEPVLFHGIDHSPVAQADPVQTLVPLGLLAAGGARIGGQLFSDYGLGAAAARVLPPGFQCGLRTAACA